MKDIKDYLHFYLGCEIYADGFQVRKLTPLVLMEYSEHYYPYKPILRQLSDMTEEEIVYLFSLDGGSDGDFIQGEAKDGHHIQVEYNHQGEKLSFLYSIGKLPTIFISYLLKQSFDLFGLIESGLAIDKTKLPTNER